MGGNAEDVLDFDRMPFDRLRVTVEEYVRFFDWLRMTMEEWEVLRQARGDNRGLNALRQAQGDNRGLNALRQAQGDSGGVCEVLRQAQDDNGGVSLRSVQYTTAYCPMNQ